MENNKITVKKTQSILEKTKGLMFSKHKYPILLQTRFGIHTFFVTEEIVILVIDSENKVIKRKTLPPWRVFFWNPKYNRIIEGTKKQISDDIYEGKKIEILYIE